MERDPVRFAWRAAPGSHLAIAALGILVGLPCLWLGLDIVRALVDDLLARRGPDGATAFLRYAIELPDRIREEPLVIVPGASLSPADLGTAIAAGLAAILAVAALLAGLLQRLAITTGSAAVASLSDRVLEAIASAPIAAGRDARRLAATMGDALGDARILLGWSAAPILLGAVLVALTIYTTLLDASLGLALLIGLGAVVFAAPAAARARARLAASWSGADASYLRAQSELARHLPALVVHGAARTERARVAADRDASAGRQAGYAARDAIGAAILTAATALGPVAVLALAAWAGLSGRVSAGDAVAAALAALAATAALVAFLRWRRGLGRARTVFAEIAQTLGGLQARRGAHAVVDLPAAGALVAEDLATSGRRGERLVDIDLALTLPAHIGLAGPAGSGARAFAAVLGGEIAVSAGRVTLGGIDLADADPATRPARLAYAGGETYLFAGSLRDNLLYGTAIGPEGEAELGAAIAAAGLDGLVAARGLAAGFDPRREPRLAEAVVEARRRIRDELAARGHAGLVEPFALDAYNAQATIGENILFGVALGDTFRETNLPSQPFVKGLLDGEDLAKPLAAIGAALARNTLELFSDLPQESTLVGRFAPFSGAEREEFARLLQRRDEGRRRPDAARDNERLVGLALRYSESRQRLGLVGPELQDRVVQLRSRFASTIPKSLQPAVEFFHPDRVCAAASIRDNLLFGRIDHQRARAERDVMTVVRAGLREVGLEADIARIGLSTRIDPAASGLLPGELAAVDVVRCLIRQPATLVVERALDELAEADATALAARLATALSGRGLVMVVPEALVEAVSPHLERVVTFSGGRIAAEPPQAQAARIAG